MVKIDQTMTDSPFLICLGNKYLVSIRVLKNWELTTVIVFVKKMKKQFCFMLIPTLKFRNLILTDLRLQALTHPMIFQEHQQFQVQKTI